MPQVQVVDTTENKPDPTGVQEFFSKLGHDYKDKGDRVEIENLIGKYQQNREDANAWEDLQLGLEKSNISPSRRLETQQNLNEIRKNVVAEDKALNAQAGKKAATQTAKRLIKRQKELLATGHVGSKVAGIGSTGRKAGSTFSKEGNTVRSEYVRNGKALIQAAAPIVIRNKAEFEVLAEDLYDDTKSQEEIKGILNSLENIVEDELNENPATAKEQAPSIKEGQTASGPNGQKIIFKGGKWQPV